VQTAYRKYFDHTANNVNERTRTDVARGEDVPTSSEAGTDRPLDPSWALGKGLAAATGAAGAGGEPWGRGGLGANGGLARELAVTGLWGRWAQGESNISVSSSHHTYSLPCMKHPEHTAYILHAICYTCGPVCSAVTPGGAMGRAGVRGDELGPMSSDWMRMRSNHVQGRRLASKQANSNQC